MFLELYSGKRKNKKKNLRLKILIDLILVFITLIKSFILLIYNT